MLKARVDAGKKNSSISRGSRFILGLSTPYSAEVLHMHEYGSVGANGLYDPP